MQRTNSTEADALDAVLAELAKKHLDLATLTPRNADALDFHELPVWKIRAALEAAYRAGLVAGRRKEPA